MSLGGAFHPAYLIFPLLSAYKPEYNVHCVEQKRNATSPLAGSIFWGSIPKAVINHPQLRPRASLLPTVRAIDKGCPYNGLLE